MKLTNLLQIAIRALQRNKLRALLTMLGIIIGVAAVIAMVAIGQGSKQSIQSQLSGMGSNMITVRPFSNTTVGGGARLDQSGLQTLTLNDIQAIKSNAKYISSVSPAVSGRGQAINGNKNWPTTIMGVSNDYLSIRNWPLKEGADFNAESVTSAAKVCLLGQTVVDNIFNPGEDPVGKIIRFNKIPFKVIGVLAAKGENAFGSDQDDIILAPYTTVQQRILAIPYIQNIYASSISEGATDSATAELTRILRESHKLKPSDEDDFQIRTMAELINTFSSTSQLLTVLLTAIAGISLVIGGIGIMNIMYVSVTERTKEIGLRMSIGARGIDILMQFLIEAVVISIIGGIIGVLLGISASKLITIFLKWPTLISPSSIIISFAVCGITGIFFGYYPAVKASRLDPIEALHYE
ncbi:MAG TPA: ABC transporter permease [Hanamia sp.]|nr:ABC transporter permease [Hanamia sp.]